MADWVPALLQVSDPLFPTGAYAHSMGLEQWAETSGYRTAEDLMRFFSHHAGPSLARLELPYLRFALDQLAQDEMEELYALEAEIEPGNGPKRSGRQASIKVVADCACSKRSGRVQRTSTTMPRRIVRDGSMDIISWSVPCSLNFWAFHPTPRSWLMATRVWLTTYPPRLNFSASAPKPPNARSMPVSMICPSGSRFPNRCPGPKPAGLPRPLTLIVRATPRPSPGFSYPRFP